MDSVETVIWSVLPQLDREKLEVVVYELVANIGVEGPDDLQFIKEEDIKHLLTPVQCRKLLHSFKCGKKCSILAFLLNQLLYMKM